MMSGNRRGGLFLLRGQHGVRSLGSQRREGSGTWMDCGDVVDLRIRKDE